MMITSLWLILLLSLAFLLVSHLPHHDVKPTSASHQINDCNCNTTRVVISDKVYQHGIQSDFLSFTIDSSQVNQLANSNFWTSPLVRNLAKALAPAYLRVGGTQQDYTDYQGSAVDILPPIPSQATLNVTTFQLIVDFCQAVGWKFVFGINAVSHRNSFTNQWDPNQFITLLDYVALNNISLAGWELSNEPDLKCMAENGSETHQCEHQPPRQEELLIPPANLAQDFQLLRLLLDAKLGSGESILGPDVTPAGLAYYARPFLANLSFQINALTWHHYYGPGSGRPNALVEANFSQPAILDRFMDNAASALQLYWQNLPIISKLWLGETSSTYGGGTSNVSNGFVAGFLWLDKLGLASLFQTEVVCRQVFAQARYSILGTDNLPNPDYWTSVLWKRLVGNSRVLFVKQGLDYDRSVRSYAYCGSSGEDVTVAILNTLETEHAVKFVIPSVANQSRSMTIYLFTSYPGVLSSRDTFLNQQVLRLVNESSGELPDLNGRQVSGWKLTMPAKSYGYVVLHHVNLPSCTEKLKSIVTTSSH
jgi:heparanase 1